MTAAQLADVMATRGNRFALGSNRANLVADGLRRLRRLGESVQLGAGVWHCVEAARVGNSLVRGQHILLAVDRLDAEIIATSPDDAAMDARLKTTE
ncbi:hypothetical protein CT676_41480 [Bradyrhizobium sp. MOS001]|uniref:hypothetical protein n=1 Tax=unclassified Bradyrhizobium TaxID=2631580 RepID=UPI001074A914|nr:hypothetical protein [Bradyrhizobium sp. MOS001]TFW53497.1 hypothetical protein CT676_41480 [Bradyrhizobium sp. MOS001]